MTPEKKMARLETLKKKHRELDKQIEKEYKLHIDVTQMKSDKLRMKQEIERLERKKAEKIELELIRNQRFGPFYDKKIERSRKSRITGRFKSKKVYTGLYDNVMSG